MIETMPSAAARRIFEDQIPSFMTVFDLDAETAAERDIVTLLDPKLVAMDAKAPSLADSCPSPGFARPTVIHSDQSHGHHDSPSAHLSESSESSPTTTLSTTDSSSLSDPSPSSSPDSPVDLIPLNNYPSTTFDSRPPTAVRGSMPSIPEIQHFERPMTSPYPRRPRNTKGLSIQPPLTTTATCGFLASEPSSPSFIKPAISAMKRKPSQLSLKTNTSDLIKKTSLEAPASPALPPILQRRALKHSSSSPHMFAAIKSSTFGPPGGMTFPKVLERNESGLSEVLRPMKSKSSLHVSEPIAEEAPPIRTQMANRSEPEPFDENVNNEDQKSPGYPDGPIAIYEDNVYLYLEPTAEEASRFDVVINVAREVQNPFEARQRLPPNSPTAADDSPVPDTAVSTISFATAFEFPSTENGPPDTPTTPRAHLLPVPEYIHVPWDHNTDIAPDLPRLCEIIENRTKAGKKVLVHCQQGASRSASLIIAYGLYQSPELSVNDAYYAAQSKSRWISPNMKLMYSLQDFYKHLSRKRMSPSSGYRPRTGRSPSKHRLLLSVHATESAPKEPLTAPLPAQEDGLLQATSQRGSDSSNHPTGGPHSISPGPASAPLSYSWKEHMDEATDNPVNSAAPARSRLCQTTLPDSPDGGSPLLPSVPSPAVVPEPVSQEHVSQHHESSPSGRQDGGSPGPSPAKSSPGLHLFDMPAAFSTFPLRTVPNKPSSELQACDGPTKHSVTVSAPYFDNPALMSPRAETMITSPLHNVSEVAGMRFAHSNQTPTEGLFSPREQSFPSDPLSFLGRMMGFGRPPQAADPRSPPTRGEAPIVRSIDELI